MSDWFEARIAAVAPAGDGLIHVALEASEDVIATHEAPGQYLKVAVEGAGEGIFAIASRPGPSADEFDLLLKLGSPVSDAIQKLARGAAVRISGAQGKGFPLTKAADRNLVLVATGSGISAIRSVIEAILAHRDRHKVRKVSLYFGARTPTAFAYRSRFEDWRAGGVEVVPVVSRPSGTGWTGLTGHVQAHFASDNFSSSVAFLCGQKAMVVDVRKVLGTRGMPADSVFLNF